MTTAHERFRQEANAASGGPALLVGFGGATAFFCLLIALTGNSPGWGLYVVLAVSLAAIALGARMLKQRFGQVQYRVKRGSVLTRTVLLWGGIIALLVVAVLLAKVLQVKGGGFIIAGIPFFIGWYLRRSVLATVTRHGIGFPFPILDWVQVRKLVITDAFVDAHLDPDVLVPRGVKLAEPDPSLPPGPRVRSAGANIDANELLVAVRRFAPAAVPVERH